MDNTKESPTVLSLCTGYGGIEKGLERALGKITVLANVEIGAFADANLVSKMEQDRLDPVPIWTDIKTFNGKIFRDRVDILTAGFPCQPFSTAGVQKGTEDPRHLWPFIEETISQCHPQQVFLENVEGIIPTKTLLHRPGLIRYCEEAESRLGKSWGVTFRSRLTGLCGISVLRYVKWRLELLGYKCESGIFSAEEVGAPHQRKRVFILGNSQSSEEQWVPEQVSDRKRMPSGGSSGELDYSQRKNTGAAKETQPAVILPSVRWPSRPGEPQHEWEEPRVVANPTNTDRGTGKKGVETETEQWRCGSSDESSNMADSESMHGGSIKRGSEDGILSEDGRRGDTERELGRATDGYRSRVDPNKNRIDRMMLVGNGVVPATAEKAYITLLEKFFKPVDEQLSF